LCVSPNKFACAPQHNSINKQDGWKSQGQHSEETRRGGEEADGSTTQGDQACPEEQGQGQYVCATFRCRVVLQTYRQDATEEGPHYQRQD
jgi:hypothetical protein